MTSKYYIYPRKKTLIRFAEKFTVCQTGTRSFSIAR